MFDTNHVKEQVASFLKQPVANLTDETPIADLVQESFILVEMIIELQEELGVFFDHEDLKQIQTVGDMIWLLEHRTQGG